MKLGEFVIIKIKNYSASKNFYSLYKDGIDIGIVQIDFKDKKATDLYYIRMHKTGEGNGSAFIEQLSLMSHENGLKIHNVEVNSREEKFWKRHGTGVDMDDINQGYIKNYIVKSKYRVTSSIIVGETGDSKLDSALKEFFSKWKTQSDKEKLDSIAKLVADIKTFSMVNKVKNKRIAKQLAKLNNWLQDTYRLLMPASLKRLTKIMDDGFGQ